MPKIRYLLASLLCVCTQVNADYPWNNLTNPGSYFVNLKIDGPRRGSQDWSTLRTLATGAAVGAGTGMLARIIDSNFPGKLFYWYLTFSLRNAIVYSMIDKAKENGERMDGNLFFSSAWISDWIAYLMCANLGETPERRPNTGKLYIHKHEIIRTK